MINFNEEMPIIFFISNHANVFVHINRETEQLHVTTISNEDEKLNNIYTFLKNPIEKTDIEKIIEIIRYTADISGNINIKEIIFPNDCSVNEAITVLKSHPEYFKITEEVL